MTRNPVIEFDSLQLYFGEPYVVDVEDAEGTITLLQPTIGDLVRIGQKRFYMTITPFVTNTTQYRLPLWDMGIDWNEFSDFNLFLMLINQVNDKEVLDLMFDGLDFTKFELYSKKDSDGIEHIVLYDEESKIEINEMVYHHISQYFRNVFNIFPEEKLTKQDILKEWFIQKDRTQQRIDAEKKNTPKDFGIRSVISACVNHPGFKYKLQELRDVHICEFYDSVRRLQIYESATACMKGLFSGFVSAKDINPDSYNFMKDI